MTPHLLRGIVSAVLNKTSEAWFSALKRRSPDGGQGFLRLFSEEDIIWQDHHHGPIISPETLIINRIEEPGGV